MNEVLLRGSGITRNAQTIDIRFRDSATLQAAKAGFGRRVVEITPTHVVIEDASHGVPITHAARINALVAEALANL